ncbi:MAG TPA: leucine--tRNA ligase [Gammaproteobacteria bacterium]|nr:leucine--tRNA ligase [Gammaproteobacteria bacterium]
MNPVYDPQTVETKAQAVWEESGCFIGDENRPGEKYYCLAMFPYPSGRLHMGHVRCYTLGDVIARYRRLKGYNVLHPMGWDAFGLPAENAAIKHNIPPAKWTRDNIDYMRTQMQRLGFGMDWSREFATCDSDYYRWEQWLFLRLYEKGMVYRKNAVVNWDPEDQTVLANEQVVDGRGWRSGAVVERREMAQWFLKITDYARELLDELDDMSGWPESVKSMQRNWIGRSEGAEIDFVVEHDPAQRLTVFTTRPDTLLGATYVAVAAEHPLAALAATIDSAVADFIEACSKNTTAEADMATMEKAGVATELQVRHPLTGKLLPVWVANFVLMEYGSGAVMSVPAHDQRDWEFAQKYGIDIVQVIEPMGDEDCDLATAAFTAKGRLVNSGEFDGQDFDAAFKAIVAALEATAAGRSVTNYRLRDWGVSRQRYWGCPIPVIHCDSCGVVPVPEADLPVELPTDVTFEGVSSPLHKMDEFLNVPCPKCGAPARRETDTFDTFMESSWYFARFASPDAATMVDERTNFWAPVDHYVGGIEHAILHLLYARFYFKLMRDEGLVQADEPFKKLMMLGMVLQDGKKMSKSAGDAGDPQKLLDRYGADTVRTAMMFAAPPEQSFEWSEAGLEGAARFLKRLWTMVHDHTAAGAVAQLQVQDLSAAGKALRRKTHETLQKADDDYGRRQQFNTVVSAVMELLNTVGKTAPANDADRAAVQEAWESAVLIISPIAPHIAHELWGVLGRNGALVEQPWPGVDAAALEQDSLTLAVQVNGKVRGQIDVAANAGQEAILALAKADANVQRHIEGKAIRKEIVVPSKLVNIVVG